jgi:hypothetical protein
MPIAEDKSRTEQKKHLDDHEHLQVFNTKSQTIPKFNKDFKNKAEKMIRKS